MIRKSASLLTLGIIILAFTSSAQSQTVRHYKNALSDNTRVSIKWNNINGLGDVSGTWHFAGGDLSFTGKNSRPGYLSIRFANGATQHLHNQKTHHGFGWTDNDSVFLIADDTFKAVKASNMVTRHYTASYNNGEGFGSGTIHWHNINGNGRIEGSLTTSSKRTTFAGQNGVSGQLTFSDAVGNHYILNKSTDHRGKVVWTGQIVSGPSKSVLVTLTAL
ncbi:MAG: hypothetical protein P1V20_06990 [Verrucomicrobiales bacterium]|nr:hypothetical protein [Verrucomicrobiales bacterium]